VVVTQVQRIFAKNRVSEDKAAETQNDDIIDSHGQASVAQTASDAGKATKARTCLPTQLNKQEKASQESQSFHTD
jgi:hypothetical protein